MTRRRRNNPSRGEDNIAWIEQYCVVPNGPQRQRYARLTAAERATVLMIYDGPGAPRADVPVTGHLAAYLALLHLCGYEAPKPNVADAATAFKPNLETSAFTMWDATTANLREVLQFDQDGITCRALGTVYKAVA
jgi:hypothetical protein